jgi:hypothetical protein
MPDDPHISFSFVRIDEDLVRRVAERCGANEADVWAYLRSEFQQDDTLLHAFEYFGVFPTGKHYYEPGKPRPDDPLSLSSMGCRVVHAGYPNSLDCRHTKPTR